MDTELRKYQRNDNVRAEIAIVNSLLPLVYPVIVRTSIAAFRICRRIACGHGWRGEGRKEIAGTDSSGFSLMTRAYFLLEDLGGKAVLMLLNYLNVKFTELSLPRIRYIVFMLRTYVDACVYCKRPTYVDCFRTLSCRIVTLKMFPSIKYEYKISIRKNLWFCKLRY